MERGVMPKETIQDTLGEYDVRVGWGPDTAQLGLESVDGRSLVTVLYGTERSLNLIAEGTLAAVREYQQAETGSPTALGRQILDIIETSSPAPTGSYSSIWVELNRAGLNLLIKAARRARDAAYGRDE